MSRWRLTFVVLAIGVSAAGARGALGQPAVPPLTGRVVDNADLLSPSVEAALTAQLTAHEDSTSNQIAVLTVPSLNGENLEQWATEVFRTWGLGRADEDNGVLILIARDDRKIRIEVGYGLEGSLTDAAAGAIIRNEMTPRFRDGDFEGGTMAAVEAVIGTIQGEYVPPEESSEDMPWWGALLMGLLMGGLPIAITFGQLVGRPFARYLSLVVTAPIVFFATWILGSEVGLPYAFWISATLVGLYVLAFIVTDVILSRSPEWQEKRAHHIRKQKAFARARKAGSSRVVVDGVSYSVPTASSSSGGGFSGGGGSSGGGGASGGW